MFDPENGTPYAIIYSDDTDKEVPAELTFLMPVKDVRSLATGTAAPLSRDEATGMQKTAIALMPGGGAILALTPADGSDVVLAFKEALQLNDLPGAAEKKNLEIVFATENRYVLAEGNEEAVLSYNLETLIKYCPPEAGLYIIPHGSGPITVQSSADGKMFTTLGERIEKPVWLPRDTKQFRFVFKPGASMRGFELVAVRGPQTGEARPTR